MDKKEVRPLVGVSALYIFQCFLHVDWATYRKKVLFQFQNTWKNKIHAETANPGYYIGCGCGGEL